MSEVDKLLAVLNLTENSPERYGWLLSTIREHNACCPAELAFRLRDEVVKIWKNPPGYWVWGEALKNVYCKVTKREWDGIEFRRWFVYESQPIHWVISSLIAKELAKEQENGKD